MRNYLHYIVCLLVLLTVSESEVSAQDVGSPSFESYDLDPVNREKFSLTPGESIDPPRSTTSTTAKDSSTVVRQHRSVFKPSPVVPKDQSKGQSETDNSVLSFNFLYYLIQKYKMQDIVD